MMGPDQETQAALFWEFSLEDHVPQDHLLRSIDRFVALGRSSHGAMKPKKAVSPIHDVPVGHA